MRKPYVVKQEPGWWLSTPFYRRYMLREATALPLLIYTLVLMSGVYRLAQGEAAFAAWIELQRGPLMIGFHALVFLASVLHAVTWLELVPKILVIPTRKGLVSALIVKRVHQAVALVSFVGLICLAIVFSPGLS